MGTRFLRHHFYTENSVILFLWGIHSSDIEITVVFCKFWNKIIGMSDTKMLQALIDGQAQIREDIKKLKGEMNERFDKTDKRIDKLGLQLETRFAPA